MATEILREYYETLLAAAILRKAAPSFGWRSH